MITNTVQIVKNELLVSSELPVMEDMQGAQVNLETGESLRHTILLPGQEGTKRCFLTPHPTPLNPVPRDLCGKPGRFWGSHALPGSTAWVSVTSTARVAPELLARTWKRRVLAGAVCPPSREVPPL